MSLGNLGNAAPGNASVTATIVDPDAPPAVNLSLSASSLGESGGSDTLTATLSAAAGVNVTVPLTFSGTAAKGTDYAASNTSIFIPAGLTTGTITLNGIGLGVATGNKTLTMGLGTLVNAQAGAASPQVTATVIDAAPPPASTLSLLPVTATGMSNNVLTLDANAAIPLVLQTSGANGPVTYTVTTSVPQALDTYMTASTDQTVQFTLSDGSTMDYELFNDLAPEHAQQMESLLSN